MKQTLLTWNQSCNLLTDCWWYQMVTILGLEAESELRSLKSHPQSGRSAWDPFPSCLGLQICFSDMTRNFPELIKSGCWSKPNLVMYSLLFLFSFQFSSVQLLSRVRPFVTPWTAARQAFLSITNSQSLLKLHQVHQVSDAIKPSHPLLSPSPPAFSLSQHQGLFQWVSSLQQWPKYWSFSFSISPSNEYSGLISFRIDLFDFLAVQGTLKSLRQHNSSKASILWRLAFFMVQLSHPHMTTRKTIALTRWTFVGKVMSLLFNKLSRLVIAFLPRSKHLLISWLQSPSAVILESQKSRVSAWKHEKILHVEREDIFTPMWLHLMSLN